MGRRFSGLFKEAGREEAGDFCGDLNVAHEEIDLKNPKTNRRNAGFTDEEREKCTAMLNAGFIDTYRYFYPDREGVYSWWSYRFKAREKNAGWRIDYFCVSGVWKNICGERRYTQRYTDRITVRLNWILICKDSFIQ